jgi:hypothetical protein
MQDPLLLQGDGALIDTDTGRPVNQAYVLGCVLRFRTLLHFLADVHGQLITLTLNDYASLPATVLDALRIYAEHLAKTKGAKP